MIVLHLHGVRCVPVNILGALYRRPFLTGGNLTNVWYPGNIQLLLDCTKGAFDAPSRLKGRDLDKNGYLQGGDLDFKHFRCQIPLGQHAPPPSGRSK